jgi:hypothetical protein
MPGKQLLVSWTTSNAKTARPHSECFPPTYDLPWPWPAWLQPSPRDKPWATQWTPLCVYCGLGSLSPWDILKCHSNGWYLSLTGYSTDNMHNSLNIYWVSTVFKALHWKPLDVLRERECVDLLSSPMIQGHTNRWQYESGSFITCSLWSSSWNGI